MTTNSAGCWCPGGRPIYFLKAFAGPDAKAVAFAWAERVRLREGRIEAANVQTPVPAWRNGGWDARGLRLSDRTFTGRAYRAPAPPWFVREDAGETVIDPATAREALELRLHTTPLGPMCRHDEIRLALAQDRLAARLAPGLAWPDFLAEEDRLAEEWAARRPVAAAEAAAALAALPGDPAWPPEGRRWRQRLRAAALRRLDAAAVGREVFAPCPPFFGEPYRAAELAPGLIFKAGIVRAADYWPGGAGEARSRAWRADPRLVALAEAQLFPFSPGPGGTAGDFAAVAAAWLGTAALREFEATSPWPLFPHALVRPDGATPPGFRRRIRPETMRALGGSDLTLAAAGLSPYVAAPFADYCAARRAELAAPGVAALAAAKWLGLDRPLAHDVLQSGR